MFRFSIRDVLWLTVVAGCLFAWWHDRDALYQDRHWYRRSAELLQKKSIQVIEAAEKLGYEASYDKDGKFTGLTQRQDQAEISN